MSSGSPSSNTTSSRRVNDHSRKSTLIPPLPANMSLALGSSERSLPADAEQVLDPISRVCMPMPLDILRCIPQAVRSLAHRDA